MPKQSKSKRGRKATKGPRLPNPKKAVEKADGNRSGKGPWGSLANRQSDMLRRHVQVGRCFPFRRFGPRCVGLLPILVVLVRDPQGKFDDKYLFTTDVNAKLSWVISTFSRRWSIEVVFKASKQVMKIQAPQHWCRQSIEKLSPWVWLMQSVIGLWYITEGHKLPQMRAARRRFGEWDTEWSLARYAPHPPRGDPREYNKRQVGHQGRPPSITRRPGKLLTSRRMNGEKPAKVQFPFRNDWSVQISRLCFSITARGKIILLC